MTPFEKLLAEDLRSERRLAWREVVCLLFTIAVVLAVVVERR